MTKTTITWAWGTQATLNFDPAADTLDFGWMNADNFTIAEVNGSVVISIPSNNQSYTLAGVTLDELSLANIVAKDSSAVAEWTEALAGSTGGGSGGTGSTGGGTGSGGSTGGGSTGATTTVITWSWGSDTVLAFNPDSDKLDFGWFSADNFTISEVNGSVVISIPSNDQTYTLTGVTLDELSLDNIVANDSSALAEWRDALAGGSGSGGSGSGGGTVDPGTDDPGTGGGTDTPGTGGEADYADPWTSTTVYVAGDQVSVGNLVYEANWWTQGDEPAANSGAEGSGKVWTVIGYMDTTPVVPDAPDDLAASAVSDTTLTLRWDAAEVDGVGTVSGYEIYKDGELIGTSTGTYFKVTGLDADTTYAFTVVAVDEAGASQPSAALSVTTDEAGSSVGTDKSFSPYVDMSLTTSQDLVNMVSDAGLEAVTLAFVLSSGTDTIGWGGVGSIANDALSNGTTISSIVDQLHAMGVEVTISFGGANGQEAAQTFSSAAALEAAYQSVVDKYGVTHLDFDIEGASIANDAANGLRNEALAALQEANPDLEVSFTLPVLTDGLTQDGLDLLKDAMAAGVEISTVNIMAMDYGAYYDSGDMGDDAISAAEATLAQLKSIGLDADIVVTPMIGINDVTSEVFTLEDAQQLVDYVQSNDDIAGISMWSLGRDNGDVVGYVSPVGSGLTQDDYDFSKIFGTV
ncbi:fibronectin type III domain-containing protein [Xanthobacter sp. V4C-4]|uniref:fibronectin type III domain-containing protein n=1 Tax=Xanthobacter cornucopiae TaxID=3119924 RepID=UPI00372BE155